ncbi:tRNA (mnm(5)s(2)U34)-methyltransferase [Cohnella hongkongensis]|uniref:Class I SAM-dependent methyltransferase n=1 Tax=Cohnella hongkongensis TaxID=178337 RepID=A0ABV9FL27_9BACL
MGFLSVLSQAQQWVKSRTGPGDLAVDATAGNGSDTLFLARTVGPRGRVYAFDVQPAALENTRRRLESEPDGGAALAPAELVLAGHETMEAALPAELRGRVAAVMFNLGYLPGASSTLITRPETTIAALESAVRLLRVGGALTVVAYPGHEGGKEEAEAVEAWAAGLPQTLAQTVVYRFPQKPASPYLIALNKYKRLTPSLGPAR